MLKRNDDARGGWPIASLETFKEPHAPLDIPDAPRASFFTPEQETAPTPAIVRPKISGERRIPQSARDVQLSRALVSLRILYALKPQGKLADLAASAVMKAPWRDKPLVAATLGECGPGSVPRRARTVAWIAGLFFKT